MMAKLSNLYFIPTEVVIPQDVPVDVFISESLVDADGHNDIVMYELYARWCDNCNTYHMQVVVYVNNVPCLAVVVMMGDDDGTRSASLTLEQIHDISGGIAYEFVKYPENLTECSVAFFAVDNFEQILSEYPSDDENRIKALNSLNLSNIRFEVAFSAVAMPDDNKFMRFYDEGFFNKPARVEPFVDYHDFTRDESLSTASSIYDNMLDVIKGLTLGDLD